MATTIIQPRDHLSTHRQEKQNGHVDAFLSGSRKRYSHSKKRVAGGKVVDSCAIDNMSNDVYAKSGNLFDQNKVQSLHRSSSLGNVNIPSSDMMNTRQFAVDSGVHCLPRASSMSEIPIQTPTHKYTLNNCKTLSRSYNSSQSLNTMTMRGKSHANGNALPPKGKAGNKKANAGIGEKQLLKNVPMNQDTILRQEKSPPNCGTNNANAGMFDSNSVKRVQENNLELSSASKVINANNDFGFSHLRIMSASTKDVASKNEDIFDNLGQMLAPDPNVLPKGFLKSQGQLKSAVSNSCQVTTDLNLYSLLDFNSNGVNNSAFCNSPHPSALPLPKFSVRPAVRKHSSEVEIDKPTTRNSSEVEIDKSATRNLRRLLHLE